MGQAITVLGDLVDGLTADQSAVPVTGIALDSRRVRPGDVFIAVSGHASDGRDFIDAAVNCLDEFHSVLTEGVLLSLLLLTYLHLRGWVPPQPS